MTSKSFVLQEIHVGEKVILKPWHIKMCVHRSKINRKSCIVVDVWCSGPNTIDKILFRMEIGFDRFHNVFTVFYGDKCNYMLYFWVVFSGQPMFVVMHVPLSVWYNGWKCGDSWSVPLTWKWHGRNTYCRCCISCQNLSNYWMMQHHVYKIKGEHGLFSMNVSWCQAEVQHMFFNCIWR